MRNSQNMHEEIISAHSIEGINLNGDFVYPNYNGRSILNIPSSICRLLGIPPFGAPTLDHQILNNLNEDYKKVLLILVDAISYQRFRAWGTENEDSVWHRLLKEGSLSPITSITPSTTSAAITTLWTGTPPAQHGIAGYELFLKEYGVMSNMILHRPITYNGGTGNLNLAGFNPETFLPVSSFGPHLKKHGIPAHAFQHHGIINSGMSQMFMQDVTRHGFTSIADLWIDVRKLFTQNPDQKMYTWVYFPEVDTHSHFHGPDDERPKASFEMFSKAFENFFLDKLSAEARKDTLVLLTADHGQIYTDKTDQTYNLINHPKFTEMLHLQPSGENRAAYLHVKPNQKDKVIAYIDENWPDQFAVIESTKALEKGLFGPGEIYSPLYDRLGDLIVFAKGNAYWWWANKENPLMGRHGGLSPQEMIVPFFAANLD